MTSKWKADMIQRVRSGDPEAVAQVPHGTLNGYTGYGCLCSDCRQAMVDYQRARRHRKGISRPKEVVPTDVKNRALETYQRHGLTSACNEVNRSPSVIRSWFLQADAEVRERVGLLVETDQVRNGLEGNHCPVDGVPLPPTRQVTCSPRCTELWTLCRYQIDDAYRDIHKERIALWNIEHSDDPVVLRYSRRVIRGADLDERGRWINSSAVAERLREVMERRERAQREWGGLAAVLPAPPALTASVEAE